MEDEQVRILPSNPRAPPYNPFLQDSVRLLGAGLLPELARSLPASQHPTVIAQHVDVSVNDASWRVRYMLADVIVELQQALASELSDMKLLPAFVQLLQDSEPEVRTCAATKVSYTVLSYTACCNSGARTALLITNAL